MGTYQSMPMVMAGCNRAAVLPGVRVHIQTPEDVGSDKWCGLGAQSSIKRLHFNPFQSRITQSVRCWTSVRAMHWRSTAGVLWPHSRNWLTRGRRLQTTEKPWWCNTGVSRPLKSGEQCVPSEKPGEGRRSPGLKKPWEGERRIVSGQLESKLLSG